VAKMVRTHERFSMLAPEDAVVLVQHMHPLRLEAGQNLFREGRADSSNFMALILEGEALVSTDGGAGIGAERVLLGALKEGDLVGEQGILQETPRSATVTAKTEMMLAAIDAGKFDRLIKSKPALGCTILLSLLRTVTFRLAEANHRVHVLDDMSKKLKKQLDLEMAAPKRNQLKPEDIKPLELTPSMFEYVDPRKAT
jgi:CRP/FNR family cyclic AMP-dependent transcriptional regulator